MKTGMTGATGQLGLAVIEGLLGSMAPADIVAISRNPQPSALGAVQRHGDYDAPETLISAFSGLERLLIIPSPDLRPGVIGHQLVATIAAAKQAGVAHVYLLSAAHVRATNASDLGKSYRLAEQALADSGIAGQTVLRMNFFAETFVELTAMALPSGAMPGLAENRVAFVSRSDVAAALAGVLLTQGHEGRTYELTGPASVSGAERAAIIAEVTGRPMAYQLVSEQELLASLAQAGLPEFLLASFVHMQQTFIEGAFDVVSGDIAALGGRQPQTLQAVVARSLR